MRKTNFLLHLIILTLILSVSAESEALELVTRCEKTFEIGYPGNKTTLKVHRNFQEFTQQGLQKQLNSDKASYDKEDFKVIVDPTYEKDCAAETVHKLWPGKIGRGFVTGPGFDKSIIKPFGDEISGITWGNVKPGDVIAYYGGEGETAGHITYVTKVEGGIVASGNITIYTKDTQEAGFEHKIDYLKSTRTQLQNANTLNSKYQGDAKVFRITGADRISINDTITPDLLCDNSEELGKELDELVNKAEEDIENCRFDEAEKKFQNIVYLETDPNRLYRRVDKESYYVIDNPSQLEARNRVGADVDASKSLENVKTLRADKEKAEDALKEAKAALESTKKLLTQATVEKNKISKIQINAKSGLTNGKSKISELPEVGEVCVKTNELATELAMALTNAQSTSAEVESFYQTAQDGSDNVCSLADQTDSAEDKKTIEDIKGKADIAFEKVIDAKEKAVEKAGESENYINLAKTHQASIDKLFGEVSLARTNLSEAKTEFDNAISQEGMEESSSSNSIAVKQIAVPEITGLCYDGIIIDTKNVVSDIATKENETKKIDEETKTIRKQTEQIISEIKGEIANLDKLLASVSITSECKAGQLPNIEEAKAAVQTAKSLAEKSIENSANAEKCVNRINQKLSDFGSGVLVGDCNGTITTSKRSGNQGEPFDVEIKMDPEYDSVVIGVITNNPGCDNCWVDKEGPGLYKRKFYFSGDTDFKFEFVALDAEGRPVCSGTTVTLRAN